MQISTILSGNHGSQARAKRADGVQSALASALKKVTNPAATDAGSGASAAEILSQYDVTQITPQQFSEMTQKLRAAGALNDADLRELNQVRSDLDAGGTRPNETVNLVSFYQRKVRGLQQTLSEATADTPAAKQTATEQSLEGCQQRLSWMQKFATLHATPGAMGVDLTA